MDLQLKKGDIIQAWELLQNKYGTYYIKKVLKTVAICDKGHRFKININTDVIKPNDDYIGEVERVIPYGSRRWFVLKRKDD